MKKERNLEWYEKVLDEGSPSLIGDRHLIYFSFRQEFIPFAEIVYCIHNNKVLENGNMIGFKDGCTLNYSPDNLIEVGKRPHYRKSDHSFQIFNDIQPIIKAKDKHRLFKYYDLPARGRDSQELEKELLVYKNKLIDAYKDLCICMHFCASAGLQYDREQEALSVVDYDEKEDVLISPTGSFIPVTEIRWNYDNWHARDQRFDPVVSTVRKVNDEEEAYGDNLEVCYK